jgi:hypothetical protein
MNELKITLENRQFGLTTRSATSRFIFAGSSLNYSRTRLLGELSIFPWENVILLVILTCGTFLHLLSHLGYRKINLRSTSFYAARWHPFHAHVSSIQTQYKPRYWDRVSFESEFSSQLEPELNTRVPFIKINPVKIKSNHSIKIENHLPQNWVKYTGKIVRYKSYMESLQILYRIPMQILYRKWETWN